MRRLLPILPLLLAPLGLPAASPATPATAVPLRAAGRDAATSLTRWAVAFERGKGDLASDERLEYSDLLVDLAAFAREGEDSHRAALLALCDAYGAGLYAARELDLDRAGAGQFVREKALKFWERVGTEGQASWLAQAVLAESDPDGPPHGPHRRAAAAHLVRGERSDEFLEALSVQALGEDPFAASAALEALVGLDPERVDDVFLGALEREPGVPDGPRVGACDQHFTEKHPALEGERADRMLALCQQRMLGSGDWRAAVRGARLTRVLDDARAVPALIAGLDRWCVARDEGATVRRMLEDLSAELKTRADGRNLGAHPERWREWWRRKQAGEIADSGGENGGASRAAFFGLRPTTDRVTFVIDRSGSMTIAMEPSDPEKAKAKGSAWTRYDECTEQMMTFLESLGENAHFNIVLFHDGADSWKGKQVKATKSNLRSARTWMERNAPAGGTQVLAGVASALYLDRKGVPDLAKLEADTLIVLCDGHTDEGPEWVAPLVERILPTTRVQVQCVQVGGFSDGTLEQLAERTGGTFLEVEG